MARLGYFRFNVLMRPRRLIALTSVRDSSSASLRDGIRGLYLDDLNHRFGGFMFIGVRAFFVCTPFE